MKLFTLCSVIFACAIFASMALSSTTPTVPTSCVPTNAGALPDPHCTPGAINTAVTQATIKSTICVSGWTSTVRPPTSYTEPLKFRLMKAYGDTGAASEYELDHLIPLELGGNPKAVANLWPEPHYVILNGKAEGAYIKDSFENALHRRVCNGTMTLSAARYEMRHGTWIK